MPMSRQNRRTFLKRAAATGVATTFAIAGTRASGHGLGANDRIRVAVAGVNGRGRSHLTGFASMNDVEVAYIVDPDSRLFDSRRKLVMERGGNTPKCVQDVRQVLDDKNLDAVSIVTPNHWHTLMGIWACQAGKDVYVEKPCSHNIFEGRKLVEAARRYDRIGQRPGTVKPLVYIIAYVGQFHIRIVYCLWRYYFSLWFILSRSSAASS